jgi:hypothetical protein
MGGLLVQLVFWMATALLHGEGLFEPALISVFGGLLAVGQGTEALRTLRHPPEPPPHEDADA